MYLALFNACAGQIKPLGYKIQNNSVYAQSCKTSHDAWLWIVLGVCNHEWAAWLFVLSPDNVWYFRLKLFSTKTVKIDGQS